jgi:hypothetical protein
MLHPVAVLMALFVVPHVITLVLWFLFILALGMLIGFLFRAAIASEISKLSLSAIIARLENLAKEDAERIREEVSSLAASLRKHL